MIDAIDLGLSFGGEAGDDQAHRCAEVGRHDRCADQMVDAAHHRAAAAHVDVAPHARSEEHTSELQSLMRISYAVFCLKKKKNTIKHNTIESTRKHQQKGR